MNTSQLTFTRFIAAIAIVIFHFGKGVYPFGSGILGTVINNANVAVSYFFVLSGFVMVISYGANGRRIDAKRYYVNRIARIYPVSIFAVLMAICTATNVLYPKLLAELLLVHSLIPALLPSYNLPDWSLGVELVFYLVFPVLFNKFYYRRNIKQIGLIVISFWAFSQIVLYFLWSAVDINCEINRNFIFYNPVFHLNEFLIGNLTGIIYLTLQSNKLFKSDYSLVGYITGVVVLGLLILTLNVSVPKTPNLHNGLLAVVFAPFILLLALNRGYLSRVFSLPAFIILGEISYSIYIFQFIVFVGMDAIFHFSNREQLLYISLPALIVFSFAAHFLLELPAKRYIRKMLG